MDALEARLLVRSTLTSPFFSPDGQSVAYWDEPAKQLARIGITGGAPVLIAQAPSNIFGANWAPDDAILFGQPEGILRVSANGGTPELVIPAQASEQMDSPQLLPDGESVLFSVTTGTGPTRWDAAQIAVQSLRTGERTVVLRGGSDARYLPTGHLVYALEDGLFAVAFDVDRLEIRGGAVLMVEAVLRPIGDIIQTTATANYGVSDQGTLVYLQGSAVASYEGRLALVDRDGGQKLLDVRPAAYAGPRLSPDGTQLAVLTREESGQNIVWVYNLSGDTQMRRLAQDGNNTSPIWTPDGERITFASDRDGRWRIYSQAADGTGLAEPLTPESEATTRVWPDSWSPDGRTLSFSKSLAGDDGVWTLSLDSEREPELFYDITDGSDQFGSSFSPDGRWIAFHSDGAGETDGQVYVLPFPATDAEPRQITQDGGMFPLWTREGDELFYRRPRIFLPALADALMGVDVRTSAAFDWGAERRLSTGVFWATGDARDYDITPDGDRFLVITPTEATGANGGGALSSRIVVVENWFEELRRLVPVN